ncbi:Orotidine 5'-phosphate decarboxylase [Piedraia hortae CBS 480.64]|uniref:Orotidine 5'-phosphate decarboxylase n=1 Tax=Piedraia hortae CBS 480.64 TaxID=1314780 RepID=A0A6A7BYP4_9PEZI|nr:Orotidine 5'-phosphate decarboxylase [Piedraia hortae CBS 480.64]
MPRPHHHRPAQIHHTMPHRVLLTSYGERSEQANLPPLAAYLLRLMQLKRTNLCVSADVNTSAELLRLAEEVGDHICVLKTHADIVDDFSDKTIRALEEISSRKQFLLFEDRKFMDIGNTVQQQYCRGPLAVARWASITNAALFSGPAIVPALAEAAQRAMAANNYSVQTNISAAPAPDWGRDEDEGEEEQDESGGGKSDGRESENDEEEIELDEDGLPKTSMSGRKPSVVSISTTICTKTEIIASRLAMRRSTSRHSSTEEEFHNDDRAEQLAELGAPPCFRSLLLLAQMSSADNMFSPEYTQKCVEQARRNRDFVIGFIAQHSLNSEQDDRFITLTPGVQLSAAGDAHGQQYNTPDKVVCEGGSDIIIVGRGILKTDDRAQAAATYRAKGWDAYEKRLRGAH